MIARMVVGFHGLSEPRRRWARARYRPFLTEATPDLTITVADGPTPARARIGVPRVRWRHGRFHLAIGACHLRGRFDRAVQLIAPPTLGLNPMVFRPLTSFLLFRDGAFLLHAAAVMTGRGVWLFCGPSGAGKTTIARLAGHRRVLNDDTVAIRPDREGISAWSTPFYGDGGPSMATDNVGARIRAVFFLAKAGGYSHRALRPVDVVARAMPEVFLPLGDPGIAERVLEALAGLAASTPCFELAFAPRPALWDYVDAIV